MISRTFDAERLNGIVNHPSVRPHVGFVEAGYLDLGPLLADRRNIALMIEDGGFLFHNQGDAFEAHSFFLPEARGKRALDAANEALQWVFDNTDCDAVLARCPKGNLPVLAFTRALKFQFLRNEDEPWPSRWFSMTRDRWISLKDKSSCR